MPRFYSEKFLLTMGQLDQERIGVKLAKACVTANLPASYVAKAFDVSRMTIHSWFRGKPLRDNNATLAKKFISIVDEAIKEGELPALKLSQAREFIDKSIVKLR
jgi:hypothetical protein